MREMFRTPTQAWFFPRGREGEAPVLWGWELSTAELSDRALLLRTEQTVCWRAEFPLRKGLFLLEVWLTWRRGVYEVESSPSQLCVASPMLVAAQFWHGGAQGSNRHVSGLCPGSTLRALACGSNERWFKTDSDILRVRTAALATAWTYV